MKYFVGTVRSVCRVVALALEILKVAPSRCNRWGGGPDPRFWALVATSFSTVLAWLWTGQHAVARASLKSLEVEVFCLVFPQCLAMVVGGRSLLVAVRSCAIRRAEIMVQLVKCSLYST